MWASSYERVRGPYFLQSGGPGSALWKSTDAGETWTEVKGGGFPETMKGRISIAIAASDPNVMYTMVEADTAANPKKDPKVKAQKSPTGLYRSADAGKTWEKVNDEDTRPFYYSQVRVDPKNPDRVFWSSTPIKFSRDGGKTHGQHEACTWTITRCGSTRTIRRTSSSATTAAWRRRGIRAATGTR